MHYEIRHTTAFAYSGPVRQSLMEVRQQPRTEGAQRCLDFRIRVTPQARVHSYLDPLGTTVHHFDIPAAHERLEVATEALVELRPHPPLPPAVGDAAWGELDAVAGRPEYWDFLAPSRFTRPTPLLEALAAELRVTRARAPLVLARELTGEVCHTFAYAPQSTRVDSPIDDALRARRGVCQDFAHIMIALLRRVGVPARYVSGYLFHRTEYHDRSAADATHAWVEAYVPGPGWIGLDPTNDLVADERHIRVAVGRDYADVPPTRGVFTGSATQELRVEVQVWPVAVPPAEVSPPRARDEEAAVPPGAGPQ